MLQVTRVTGCTILGGVDDIAWVGMVALFPAGAAVAVGGERTVLASTVVAA